MSKQRDQQEKNTGEKDRKEKLAMWLVTISILDHLDVLAVKSPPEVKGIAGLHNAS